MADTSGAYLTEAENVYRSGCDAFEAWMAGDDNASAFAIHVTDMHGQIVGDVVTLDYPLHRRETLNSLIRPVSIDAVAKDGVERSFTPDEWMQLPQIDRDAFGSWTRHFAHEDMRDVLHKLDEIRKEHEAFNESVSEDNFLAAANAGFMAASEHPAQNMLRVEREAASEMLARGDADVYRLLPSGPERLEAIDAVKSNGLWYLNNREFAIRREDIAGLQKWADRNAHDLLNHSKERGEQKKTHEPEI
jgi:hypothetical protein